MRSLSSRFLSALLISTVVPFLAFGWFAWAGMRERLEGQVVSVFLPQEATLRARSIDDRLNRIRDACATFALAAKGILAPSTPGMGPLEQQNFRRAQRQAFEDLVELSPDLLGEHADLILLTDAEGAVLYCETNPVADARIPEVNRREPESVADEPWFQRLQGDEGAYEVWQPWGRSAWLHPDPGIRSQDPADFHLGLAFGIDSGTGFSGALFALIRCAQVQDILDACRRFLADEAGFPSADVMLVDADGTVLAHTDRSRSGRELRPAGLRSEVLGAEGPGQFAFAEEGRGARRAGFAPTGNRRRALRWRLVLSVTTDELFSTSRDFGRVLLLAILGILGLLFWWSGFASRAVTRPARDLATATERVAGGDLDARVPAAGSHELADLGRSFNTMTERLKESRDQLAEAERQAAWAEMARQVAHEIKNPLTPMRMGADLLQRARRSGDDRADELAERLARTVLQQTHALDRIAEDFRHFAGSPQLRRSPVTVEQLLQGIRIGCTGIFDGAAGHVLEVELPGDSGVGGHDASGGLWGREVRCDEHELQRVFLNLVQNALQAAGERPCTVRVWARIDTDRVMGTDRLIVSIADNAGGVDPDARDRLFEPYFTTKSAGTGLGLAICRRVLRAHEGDVSLAETGRAGSVFEVRLPLA